MSAVPQIRALNEQINKLTNKQNEYDVIIIHFEY